MQPGKRQSKGMVSVISTHGRLQLRFHYGGRRYYLTLGLADTQVNRKVAEAKAKLIESDIIYERFDPTLEKYKPQNALSVANTAAPLPVPKTSLLDLWEKYTQFQQAHLEETTIIRDYGKIEKRQNFGCGFRRAFLMKVPIHRHQTTSPALVLMVITDNPSGTPLSF